MKRKLIVITSSIILLLIIAIFGASQYFYKVSVDRAHGEVKLHGGEEDGALPASQVLDQQALQEREIEQWQEEQPFVTVELVSYDGLTLKAKLLPAAAPTDRFVILVHGYRGSSEQMPGITKFYHEQGFSVLKPDARGHGESEGHHIGYGWHDRIDYQGWVQYLVSEQGAEHIYLHGFSMGGAAVLMTSGEELPAEVKGIINDSGYTSVKEELSHQLKHMYGLPAFPLVQTTSLLTKIKAGFSFEEASAIEQVRRNTRPLLLIHGAEDDLVPTEMAYRIHEAAAGDKELWIVPDTGHTKAYTVAREEYERRVLAFITKTLNDD